MAHVTIDEWWRATEIPLIDTDWRNIRIYCQQQETDPFDWERCLYIVRLSPPYSIAYGPNCELESPLLYVGSGTLRDRWSTHREWLYELGHAIPGGRYEVLAARPRAQNNAAFYKDIADILVNVRETAFCLPLRNLRIEGTPRRHTYEDGFFSGIYKADRRYLWSMYPLRGDLKAMYCKGDADTD
jgi:hypothetical protein